MSAFASSYKSLLAGVSQQVARERLPGQVQSQENMLSDPVTNLRRRPGAQVVKALALAGAENDKFRAWFVDIQNQLVHLWVDCNGGNVLVVDEDYNVLQTLQNDYLKADDINSIYGASTASSFYFANVEVLPQKTGSTAPDNNTKGFFVVRTGAFSTTYSITLNSPSTSKTYTYTTPDGTSTGDAAKATVSYIAAQLADAANADTGTTGITATVSGNSVYCVCSAGTLSLGSNSGTAYITTTGQQYLNDSSLLPPQLAAVADGIVIATGSKHTPTYYRYDTQAQAWLEDGAPGSPTSLTSCPISLDYDHDTDTWSLGDGIFEGRLAGDDISNEHPPWLDDSIGITGMGTFQGRLVLLSGALVSMSASNRPTRFYRSTVTTVASDDPISIGSSANSSAAYRYCLPFQKDLLLFSEKYQALVPSGNVAITPSIATVLVTSTYDADITCAPVALGRTVLYPAPRSQAYFGFKEMLPSSYTDSQYTSDDVTSHLPKYMAGRCFFGVSSNVSNLALFCPTQERDALIVHEYLWSGDNKVQQAWHKWRFKFDLAYAYFAVDKIVLLSVRNGMVLACEVDPRAGNTDTNEGRRPFLDYWSSGTVADGSLAVPSWVDTFAPEYKDDLRLCVYKSVMAGEPVGFQYDIDTDTIQTVRSFPDGDVTVGFPYTSSFAPTPPMVEDSNGVKISANKLTILRFMLSTNGSGQYKVSVQDSKDSPQAATDRSLGTLYWSSEELALDAPRLGADSTALIPCRTNADTTTMLVYTDGTYELNCVALEYVCRYHQRLPRR